MPSRPHRWRSWRPVFAGTAALAIAALAIAGVSYAHSPKPGAITISQSGLTIQVSGTWTFPAATHDSVPNYVGYAIDWGDITTGNQVGAYHLGDGTPATNFILLNVNPSRGTSGTWGPLSHTYAAPGVYSVCEITYDLGKTTPFATTGYHSTQAGGTNHNTDNSVDKGLTPGAQCGTASVTGPTPTATTAPTPTPTPFQSFGGATATPAPTATPFQSFEGATGTPAVTLPPTSTKSDTGNGNGMLPEAVLMSLAVLSLLGSLALKPIRNRRLR